MRKIIPPLILFILPCLAYAQTLNDIDPEVFKSSPIAIMKFEEIGKECESKGGRPRYCDGLIKTHDKYAVKNREKQAELSKELNFDYNLVYYNELQRDQHSEFSKHRFYIKYVLKHGGKDADNIYEYHYEVWDSHENKKYDIELIKFFGMSPMSSYKALVATLNNYLEETTSTKE